MGGGDMYDSRNSQIAFSKICSLEIAGRKKDKEIEFHKQQSEFWAAECISEKRKANVSHVVMIIACVLSGAAIGMNMLMCQ